MPAFGLSNEDYLVNEQLCQILSIMDHFLIQYKHQFFVDKFLLSVHNLFYYQGEKYRFCQLHEEYSKVQKSLPSVFQIFIKDEMMNIKTKYIQR